MSRTRYRFDDQVRPHFVTCTIVGWLPVFTRPETMDIILDSWRFLQANNRITLFGYVILENHLHMVVNGNELGTQIGNFKSFTARSIIDFLKQQKATTLLEQMRTQAIIHGKTDQEYQLWQEGSHPKAILDEDMMRQKLEYTHYNPVKRGYVDLPQHWRYSSARNYLGETGLIEVVTQWGWGR